MKITEVLLLAIAPVSFRIDELLRQLEVEFAPLAREKGLELKFMPCSLAIRSDRRLLRRLLQNLVSNAIKYTPRGRVLVGCRRRRDKLRIDVFDTGLGIPASKKRVVFREFHRLDEGAKVARGLGLRSMSFTIRNNVPRMATILERSPAACKSLKVPKYFLRRSTDSACDHVKLCLEYSESQN